MADPTVDAPEVVEPELSTYEKLKQKQADNQRATQFISQAAERRREVLEAEAAASEERRNIFLDTGAGTVRGVAGAFEEALQMVGEFDEWALRNVGGVDLNPFDDTGKGVFISPSEARELDAEGKLKSTLTTSSEGWTMIKELVPEPERIPGQIAEPMAQFMTGFIITRRAMKTGGVLQGTSGWSQFANATVAGAAADFSVFDPHEERLSNLIESFPALQNPVTGYLAADEDDGEFEGRIKGVLEGAGMGALLEPFMYGLRVLKNKMFAEKVEEAVDAVDNVDVKLKELSDDIGKQADEVEEALDEVADEVPEGGARTVDDGLQSKRDMQNDLVTKMADEVQARKDEGRPFKTAERNLRTETNRLNKMDKELEARKVEAERAKQTEEAGGVDPDAKRHADLRHSVQRAIEIPKEIQEQFLKAVQEGDEAAASRIMNDFNANNIDFDSIENGQDIKAIMLEAERMFASLIDEVKGGVQSNVRTKLLANLVNQTPDSVHQLFKDVRGDKGIAARFYAAQRIMLASANNVREKAKAAYAAPGDTRAQAEALQAVQTHAAIQAEVKGAQTEIARALQAMSILKQDMAEGFREFDLLRRQQAPRGGGKAAWERYMDDLANKTTGLADMNARVEWSRYERAKNILIEWTINSMLSSVKTHVINFTSNVLNTFMYSFDRTLGGTYQYLKTGDRAALREIKLDWMGKFGALDQAWSLAKQAFKDGAPVTDKRQRIEFLTRQAIGSDKTDANYFRSVANRFRQGDEVLENDGTFFQKAINTIGTTVRVPGRLLITGDEFFKAINRNAEISVLSFRQADEEATKKGLEWGTEAYERFVAKRSAKLADTSIRDPENIRIQSEAIEKSRLTTFQEAPRTDFGGAAEGFINSNWFVKLVLAPFFRTPMNILRQGVMDRTPLALTVKHHRDAIARGGREAAEVQARMLTGVGAMGAFYALTSSGEEGDLGFEVIGKQPYDSVTRLSGIPDYSIRFGDTWYQFNRLEPTGMWLGMIADMRTMMKYRQDEDAAMQMYQFALFSFLNNVTDKTYMRSLSDLQDTLEGVASGKETTAARAVSRFAAGEFGKLIPQLYKGAARATEGDGESFRREVWDFWDIVRDRSTTFTEGLAPKHDILGRPVERDAGLTALVNPFALMENSDDPVDKEFFRLGFSVQPMRKTLGAEQVVLTAEEYSRMTGFMAELNTHETIQAIIESEGYEQMPDPLKIAVFKKVINQNRAAARAMVLADPSITQRVVDAKMDAALQLTGDGS